MWTTLLILNHKTSNHVLCSTFLRWKHCQHGNTVATAKILRLHIILKLFNFSSLPAYTCGWVANTHKYTLHWKTNKLRGIRCSILVLRKVQFWGTHVGLSAVQWGTVLDAYSCHHLINCLPRPLDHFLCLWNIWSHGARWFAPKHAFRRLHQINFRHEVWDRYFEAKLSEIVVFKYCLKYCTMEK